MPIMNAIKSHTAHDRPISIVITGASGFIGQQIIPELIEAGWQLLLVGRSPKRLRALFGNNIKICSYSQIAEHAVGYDVLLHLAVLNNDKEGSLKEFRAANVGLLETVLTSMRKAGIPMIIYTSSLKALTNDKSPYAITKSEAETLLRSQKDLKIINLRLAAIYGDQLKGNLSVLERLPKAVHRTALHLLTCARPATHVSHISNAIHHHMRHTANSVGYTEQFVTDGQRDNPIYKVIMRLIDLFFAVTVLGLFWWLFPLIWIAIRITSPGPGIFSQTRIGQFGQLFICYKFRSMKVGTDQHGTHEISLSAMTGIGKILRKTKIDELPQVINILLNQLSLVGPRPCLPNQKHLIAEREKLNVTSVKSGITGWAQINGIDMSQPQRLAQIDAEYIARRTVLFDISIIIRTFLGAGHNDRTAD